MPQGKNKKEGGGGGGGKQVPILGPCLAVSVFLFLFLQV